MAFDDVRFVPILQLSQVFDGYQQARVGLRRIGDLLRTPTAVQLPGDPPAQQLPVLRRTQPLRAEPHMSAWWVRVVRSRRWAR
ncbi:hypothetical protein ACW9HR_08930 [Nocardia gipuzkoensis]